MLEEKEINHTLNRLKNHPEILETIKELLDITEGGIKTADDAELALIPEVRGLGKKCLKEWAQQRAAKREGEAKKEKLKQHSKKTKVAYNIWASVHRRKVFFEGREAM